MDYLEEIQNEIKDRRENYEKTIMAMGVRIMEDKKGENNLSNNSLLVEYRKEFREAIEMLKNSEQFMNNVINKLKEKYEQA